MLEQLIEHQLPAPGYLRDDLHQPVALHRGVARPQVFADPRHRLGKARLVDGLEEVVDGARLECPDRVLVIGGDEHDHWQRLLRQVRQHLEARHARHLDVEEHQIRRRVLDGRHRVGPRLAFADDLDVRLVLQQRQHARARHRDDLGADLVKWASWVGESRG